MKIKSFIVFLLSLAFILLVTPIYTFAEIDMDYDDEPLDETTVSDTTSNRPGGLLGGTYSGSSSEEETSEEEYTMIIDNSTTNKTPVKPPSYSEVDTFEPCEEHNFVIVGFDCNNGLATIKCTVCGYSYTDYFADHITGRTTPGENPENYDPVFDLVNDGVINGKDYALLMQRYYDDFSINDIFDSQEFLFKEKFGYIYITVILLISTFAICFSVRRRA